MSSSSSSSGGTGGMPANPCGVNCSGFQAGPCQVGVCNTGQMPNDPLNTCVVVPAEDGTGCDDGKYCTVSDYCDKGVCMGGTPNDCGKAHDACTSVICYEDTKMCMATPVDDGNACAPSNQCQVSGICTAGTCVGVPKDCSSSPMAECNQVTCDMMTGQCVGTADTNKNGNPCMLSGDLCTVGKTCMAGMCVGTMPKDCSLLDIQCQIGVCDPTSGVCKPSYAPAGMSCTNGLQECQLGACNTTGTCVPSTAPDGSGCNDHDSCTQSDTCHTGVCSGAPVTGCTLYLDEGFETCPDMWTLTGDWQCGMPTGMSPVTPFDGHGVLATQLAGLYHNNDTYGGCAADSPAIDLSAATKPMLSFWAWVWTDGGDGFNVQVSIDGGTSFQPVVIGETPAYAGVIASELAWSGVLWQEGWQNYTVDLSPYKGNSSVIVRFAFESDTSGVEPGVYIDDVVVAEPVQIPLYITTPSQLPDAYVNKEYSTTITKVGGTNNSSWTQKLGVGMNNGWFTLTPGTVPGTLVLSGVPMLSGLVTFTLDVDEPTLPSNFAEQSFSFAVKPDFYYTSWEGTPCANGWTLKGDWQCGIPTNVSGPATASDGMECIGTGLSQDYGNGDTWATTTATSPPINLSGSLSPSLTFQMWVYTDGASDGLNLQILESGGTNWTVVQTVTPSYGPTIAGELAWAGDQTAQGWQLVQADLTQWAGSTVQLRFAFQSSAGSPTLPGVYIDDLLVQ